MIFHVASYGSSIWASPSMSPVYFAEHCHYDNEEIAADVNCSSRWLLQEVEGTAAGLAGPLSSRGGFLHSSGTRRGLWMALGAVMLPASGLAGAGGHAEMELAGLCPSPTAEVCEVSSPTWRSHLWDEQSAAMDCRRCPCSLLGLRLTACRAANFQPCYMMSANCVSRNAGGRSSVLPPDHLPLTSIGALAGTFAALMSNFLYTRGNPAALPAPPACWCVPRAS